MKRNKFNTPSQLPGNDNLPTRPVARGHWDIVSHQRLFMDELSKKLNITNYAQWYQVSSLDLKQNKGSALLNKYHSLSRLLQTVYPEYLIFRFPITVSNISGIPLNSAMYRVDTGTLFRTNVPSLILLLLS